MKDVQIKLQIEEKMLKWSMLRFIYWIKGKRCVQFYQAKTREIQKEVEKFITQFGLTFGDLIPPTTFSPTNQLVFSKNDVIVEVEIYLVPVIEGRNN